MTEKIVIIGNSIGAEIIYDVINRDPHIDVIAFSVHRAYIHTSSFCGKELIPIEDLPSRFSPGKVKIINAIGYSDMNRNREKIYLLIKSLGYQQFTYIHPDAVCFSKNVGEGVFVMPGVVLESFSEIGNNTYIWSNAIVAHHAKIDENCWIASGVVIAGETRIKKNCFIGVNATIVNKVTIDEYNMIGAQTLIAKSTSPNGVYISRPGELHRFSSNDYAKHMLA